MKPVYKCDYCNFMGTEEATRDHELTCMDNYDRKSCHTCVHKKFGKLDVKVINYECAAGREIPEGKLYEFCPQYERKEKSVYPLTNLFGGLF